MMLDHFILILIYASSLSICFPFITGLIKFKTFGHSAKVLFLYSNICFLTEILAVITSIISINNFFISYIVTFVEFSLFTIIFFNLLNINAYKKTLWLVLISFLAILLIDLLIINNYQRLNDLSRNTECFALIIFAILYFRKLLSKTEHKNILKLFGFWFSTACIIYFSGTFFFFIFTNYLIKNTPDELYTISMIHSFFNIIFNVLLAISLTKKTLES